jgi:uncharacterized damage-inducible protein DinB
MSDVARLANACAELLEQARDLVLKLDADVFARGGPAGSASVGAHLRHCLEAFESLFAGLARGTVNYDDRRRDARVEHEPLIALERIEAIRDALLEGIARLPDAPLRARADEPELPPGAGYVASTLARELRALASHSVHHFAVIALQLRIAGVALDPRFGVAPSTWARWQQAR